METIKINTVSTKKKRLKRQKKKTKRENHLKNLKTPKIQKRAGGPAGPGAGCGESSRRQGGVQGSVRRQPLRPCWCTRHKCTCTRDCATAQQARRSRLLKRRGRRGRFHAIEAPAVAAPRGEGRRSKETHRSRCAGATHPAAEPRRSAAGRLSFGGTRPSSSEKS